MGLGQGYAGRMELSTETASGRRTKTRGRHPCYAGAHRSAGARCPAVAHRSAGPHRSAAVHRSAVAHRQFEALRAAMPAEAIASLQRSCRARRGTECSPRFCWPAFRARRAAPAACVSARAAPGCLGRSHAHMPIGVRGDPAAPATGGVRGNPPRGIRRPRACRRRRGRFPSYAVPRGGSCRRWSSANR